MSHKINLALSVLAVSVGLASCELAPYDEPVTETYTKEFIKTFGLIDSEQDWNMATRASVTVNTSTPSEVRVYAKNDNGKYALVGDYADVSGQQTLEFDVQRGVNDVLVASGSRATIAQVGGSVNFDQQTRTTHTSDGTDTNGIVVEASDADPIILTGEEILKYFQSVLPENTDNRESKQITKNFSSSSAAGTITFTMYPIYWYTGNGSTGRTVGSLKDNVPDEVGIAYKADDGTIVHIPVYTLMEGDELSACDTQDGTYTALGQCTVTYGTNTDAELKVSKKYEYYKSKGVKVTVPQGLNFVFYICNNHPNYRGKGTGYIYSEQSWNTQDYYYTDGTTKDDTKMVGAATYTYNDKTVLCFEDWPDGGSNAGGMDLNDVVFLLDPAPVIVDEDATEWILAAEDLGSTDDYDFNDMVLSVSHVAGYNYAEVTALAAGGMLPITVYHDGTALNDGKEFHRWFGDYESSVMINTSSEGSKGTTVKIDVDKDFTMASNVTGADNMGGFSFKVVREDGTQENLYAPSNGEAPQMICLPKGWKWPKERTNITEAYPNFGEWGANYGIIDWISNVVEDNVLGNSN